MFARLTGARVLIRPLEDNEKRPSGLVLPKTEVIHRALREKQEVVDYLVPTRG